MAEMADLYRAIDGGACAALLAKLAVEKSFADKMDETRNAFQVQATTAVLCFLRLFVRSSLLIASCQPVRSTEVTGQPLQDC